MSFKPAHKPYYKSMNAFLHYTQVYQHVNSQYGFCLISESSVGRVPTYTVTLDFLRVTSNCSVLLWLNIHRSLDKVRHYRYIPYNWHSVNQLLLNYKCARKFCEFHENLKEFLNVNHFILYQFKKKYGGK